MPIPGPRFGKARAPRRGMRTCIRACMRPRHAAGTCGYVIAMSNAAPCPWVCAPLAARTSASPSPRKPPTRPRGNASLSATASGGPSSRGTTAKCRFARSKPIPVRCIQTSPSAPGWPQGVACWATTIRTTRRVDAAIFRSCGLASPHRLPKHQRVLIDQPLPLAGRLGLAKSARTQPSCSFRPAPANATSPARYATIGITAIRRLSSMAKTLAARTWFLAARKSRHRAPSWPDVKRCCKNPPAH